MSDTTAVDGNDIDAVAASLIEGPPAEKDEDEGDGSDELAQADADAESQSDEDEADEADADDEGEDEGDEDADEEDDVEQLYTVKVDGRDQQVTLEQLIRSYSAEAYSQQKMRENAEVRKTLEGAIGILQSERQQVLQVMQAMQSGQLPLQPPQMPDESLLQRDPIGYLEAQVKYNKDVAAYQQAQALQSQLTERQMQLQEQSRLAYLQDQHRALTRMVPDFADPKTAAKAKADLIKGATEYYGASPERLRGITDAIEVAILNDAVKYRQLMSGKKPAAEKTAGQANRPPIKPGSKPSAMGGKRGAAEKAKAQMKRTGSVDDVARFLLM